MNKNPAAWSCSFCGVAGTDDMRFAGGLGALMCLECLELFASQFAAPENAGQQIIGWSFESMSDADMLSRLPLIAATSGQVARYLREWSARSGPGTCRTPRSARHSVSRARPPG